MVTLMTPDETWIRARAVWDIATGELSRLTSTLDRVAFTRCVATLASCRGRIVTMGCGTSASAARKIAHSLSCIDRPSFFLSPADAPHGALGAVQAGDIIILVSKGGGTKELIGLVPSLKAKKTTLIVVTENENSALARASDLLLRVKVEREADPFNLLATTSTMVVIAVFDAICVVLMEEMGYTREQFAIIHPHGVVGDRLKRGNV
jgi:KpsF/GutQ family protein